MERQLSKMEIPLSSEKKEEKGQLIDIIKEFELSKPQMIRIIYAMRQDMLNGLAGRKSSMKMINTYVKNLPTNMQQGIHFGIDLGGSNLRVLCINFCNKKMTKDICFENIPHKILNGNSDQLFDLIADVLENVAMRNSSENIVDLKTVGFTFSFPVKQMSLTSGILMHWTKSFNVSGVVGQDVSQLLLSSINRKAHIRAENVALLNDTVGTLLCGTQQHENVSIGFIMGTGCNACYIENIANIRNGHNSNLTNGHNGISGNVVINTEFGNFGSLGQLSPYCNSYEVALDKSSLRPGEQIFEKMISGLYIVDTFKHVLRKAQVLGYSIDIDIEKVTAEQLSNIVKDYNVDKVETFCESNPNITHILGIIVCERVAIIAACGLSAIIQHMGRAKVCISADGSVIQNNVFIRRRLLYHIRQLTPDVDVEFITVKDGSGLGAAILASTF